MKKNKHKLSYRDRFLRIMAIHPNIEKEMNIVDTSQKGKGNDNIQSLVDIAIESWKIRKKANKMKALVGEEAIAGFEFSLKKIDEILEKHKLKIIDYTGMKFIEGMNGIEVISVEKNPEVKEPVILDSISPTIEIDGAIYYKSKVIVLSS